MMTADTMLLIAAVLLVLVYFFFGRQSPGPALVTVPILCVLFVYATFHTSEDPTLTIQALLVVPAILSAAFVGVLLSKPKVEGDRWPEKCVKWLLFRFLPLLILGIVLLAALVLLSWGALFMIFFILVIGFGGAAINYGLTYRHAIATHVISTIGASMRQNLPLPMALESAAGASDDKRSRILRNIRRWLVQGCSLSESIKRGYPKCPSYAVAMITAAEPINQLPQAMRSIEADMAARSDRSEEVQPGSVFYPIVLMLWMGAVVSGIVVFVMPSFASVLTEMAPGTELPAVTQALLRIAGFVGWNAVLVVVLPAFLVLVVFPLYTYIRFRQRRPDEPLLFSRIGDFLKWHLPILHWFEKNHSMVQTAQMLRLSLNAGATVNDAIANAAGLDVNNCFRKRLGKWLERVEAGDNISTAANESGVGRGMAWAFDQKVNQGNTVTILETLESLHRSDYSYRINLARFIMEPCITLLMAAAVGFVVYAIYSAPLAIIHHAAEMVYP